MRITYDPLADAVNITFKKGKVAKTKEVSRDILLDVDKNDTPLYLEILDASRRLKKTGKEMGNFEFIPFKYSKEKLALLTVK